MIINKNFNVICFCDFRSDYRGNIKYNEEMLYYMENIRIKNKNLKLYFGHIYADNAFYIKRRYD